MSGYHTTKEIDCTKVCFDLKSKDRSVEPVRLSYVVVVPDLYMSAVNIAQLSALCKVLLFQLSKSFWTWREQYLSYYGHWQLRLDSQKEPLEVETPFV